MFVSDALEFSRYPMFLFNQKEENLSSNNQNSTANAAALYVCQDPPGGQSWADEPILASVNKSHRKRYQPLILKVPSVSSHTI